MFNEAQEEAVTNLVLANNAITLREIQSHIIRDNTPFNNIGQVSLSTLARLLYWNQVQMKQLYRAPFERNAQRITDLRHVYVEVSTIWTSTALIQ